MLNRVVFCSTTDMTTDTGLILWRIAHNCLLLVAMSLVSCSYIDILSRNSKIHKC